MAAFSRVEHGRLVEPIPHFDKGTGVDQQLDSFKVASPGRANQSRSSVTGFRVNLRAPFQQKRNALAPAALERSGKAQRILELLDDE